MKHGTRTAYTYHRCRCDQCTIANRDYNRNWQRTKARIRYGLQPPTPPRWVDATEARQHLLWLASIGMGRRTVSELTGLSQGHVKKIRDGITTGCLPSTAQKILAVGRHQLPDNIRIDATRTLEQIDDILAQGVSKVAIARIITGNPDTKALQVYGPQVSVRTAKRVDAMWRRVMAPELARREVEAERKRDYRARQAA